MKCRPDEHPAGYHSSTIYLKIGHVIYLMINTRETTLSTLSILFGFILQSSGNRLLIQQQQLIYMAIATC